MNIKLDVTKLATVLASCKEQPNPTSPILGGVKLEIVDGDEDGAAQPLSIKFVHSPNIVEYLVEPVSADDELGAVVVPLKEFKSLISRLAAAGQEEVTLATKKDKLLVTTNSSKSSLPTFPVEDFPVLAAWKNGDKALFDVEFTGATSFMAGAASTADTQNIMSYARLVAGEDGAAQIWSCDGTQSYTAKTTGKVVAPGEAKIHDGILAQIPKDAQSVRFVVCQNRTFMEATPGAKAHWLKMSLGTPTETAKFPPIEKLFGFDKAVTVKIGKNTMLGILAIIGAPNVEAASVRLDVREHDILATTRDTSGTETYQAKADAEISGGQMTIFANYRLLRQAIQLADEETLIIEFSSPRQPIVVNGKTFSAALMPKEEIKREAA